ncbi:MAG: transglycosylase domain-containing protein [Silicimonas sp.]
MSGSKSRRPPLVADKRPSRKSKATMSRKTTRSRKKAAPSRRRSRNPLVWLVASVFRLIWGIGWRVTALVVLAVAGAVLYYAATLPPVNNLLDARARGSVTLLDREGKVFAWRGEQFGGQITAQTVSPYLKDAVIATEDKRFYGHFGISPRGIASAVRINLSEGRGPLSGHGGSTITQQTAKLLCLGTEYDPASGMTEAEFETDCRRTTLTRKIKEAVYAMAMELRYSKDDILTIYLNRAYLGAGARGFEAAAQRYFGRSANELLPAEAAMLAGLLVAPTRYAPTADLQRSQDRAAVIIGLMEDQGYLTASQAADARQNPARLSAAAEARAGGYFADWVMDQGPGFLTNETTEDVVIRTTFDQKIQSSAEEALQWVFENKVREGSKAQTAIVVMSADGAVRAMVGGRKFKGVAGQFNRAIQAKRQTGSAFKPFVYAAALDLGYSPNDTVIDEPYCIDVPGSGRWCPSNYDNSYAGRVTLTDALARSLNIPAVKVFERVGREAVANIASDFGIESDLAVGPALALGTSESTLLEMTGAYAGILNGGSSVEPYGLVELMLKGDDEPLLTQEGGIVERVVTESAARQLIYMMSQVIERGTGTRAQLPGRPAAGKSGTTQAARDAWFIGFTADYVTGVWMGYDDNTPLTGVTGGGLPAEVWKETMLRIHEGVPVRPLPMIAPEPSSQVATERSQRNRTGENAVDRVILNVLNEIFGLR